MEAAIVVVAEKNVLDASNHVALDNIEKRRG